MQTQSFEYILPKKNTSIKQRLTAVRGFVRSHGGRIKVLNHNHGITRSLFGDWAHGHVRVKGLDEQAELELRKKHGLYVLPTTTINKTLPENIRISQATQKDINALHELERTCFAPELQATKEEITQRIQVGRVFKAVDTETGKIVGAMLSSNKRMDRLNKLLSTPVVSIKKQHSFSPHHYLIDLAVNPDARYRSVGRALINHAVNQAANEKFTKVFLLAVNRPTFGFFPKVGFLLHESFDPNASTRIYWKPLQVGQLEKEYKARHAEINASFRRLKEYSAKNRVEGIDPDFELRTIILGAAWKYGREGEERSKTAARVSKIVTNELFERFSERELEQIFDPERQGEDISREHVQEQIDRLIPNLLKL